MPNVIEGERTAAGAPLRHRGVAVQRVDHPQLLDGAVQTLRAHGVADEAIDVAWVPGALEIPRWPSGWPVGPLRRGALPGGGDPRRNHARPAHQSPGQPEPGRMALDAGMPVLFGVLTCNTLEQAIHRSGGNVGNKGVECAEAALEMASLLKKLP